MEKVIEKSAIERLRAFFDGRWFPCVFAVIMFICGQLALDILGFFIVGATVCVICVFHNDSRPIIPVALTAVSCISHQNTPGKGDHSNFYSQPWVIACLIVVALIVVTGFIIGFIRNRREGALKGKKLLLGIAILCSAMILGGIFTENYDMNHFVVAGLMLVTLMVFYLYFTATMDRREDNLSYVAFCCMVAGGCISMQVFAFYLRYYQPWQPLDWIWKDGLLFGGYVSNSAGEMIAILMPACFMFAAKEKRGWIYLLVATAFAGAIYLTLSRMGLLVGALVYIAGVAYCSFRGNSKKVMRTLFLTALAIGVLALLVLIVTGKFTVLFDYFLNIGVSGRGRWALWSTMLGRFIENPIFGDAFSTLINDGGYYITQHEAHFSSVYTALAHNTIIQMLASCGIVGIISYAFHRYQTVKLFVKTNNKDTWWFGAIILAFLVTALFDQIFFFPNFTIMYALLLVVCEKEGTKKEEKSQKGERKSEKA